jgi:nitrogen fixation protein NifU and related proteins
MPACARSLFHAPNQCPEPARAGWRQSIMPGIQQPGKRFSSRVNLYVSVFPEPGCAGIKKSCLQTAVYSRIEVCGVSRDTPAMYSEAVLDHFQNPRNAGTLNPPSASISVENPVCGDILELSARMESGRIAEARFRTRGCVTALACSSLLTELLRGKTPAEARAITSEQISAALGGLPPATLHGAQLARDAVQALVAKLG